MNCLLPAFRSAFLTVCCLPLVLGACTLAPKYTRPTAPIPSEYHKGAALVNREFQEMGWKQFFTDPAIQRLVEVALANNRDLRIAMLNI